MQSTRTAFLGTCLPQLALAVSLALSTTPAAAQVGRSWVDYYPGTTQFQAFGRAVVVDGTGNAYVAVSAQADIHTIKYDVSGNRLWSATAGALFASPSDIAVDANERSFVTGSVFGLNLTDYLTLAYDADGTLAWSRRFPSVDEPNLGADLATAVALDPAGNVYVTGNSSGASFTTIKYDNDGKRLWFAVRSVNQSFEPPALAVDASGNAFVAGSADNGAPTGEDFILIKYDPSGSELWFREYDGGFGSDVAVAVTTDGAGNVYVTGRSDAGPDSDDYVTIAYDAAGSKIWLARYNGPIPDDDNDCPTAIAVDAAGNVYVTGESDKDFPESDYLTVKYDNAGNEVWAVRAFDDEENRPRDWSSTVVATCTSPVRRAWPTGTTPSTTRSSTIPKAARSGMTGSGGNRPPPPSTGAVPRTLPSILRET